MDWQGFLEELHGRIMQIRSSPMRRWMRRGKQPEECGTDWRESRSSVTPWGT